MTPAREITYGFILGVIGIGGPIILAMPSARAFVLRTAPSYTVAALRASIAIAESRT
jgi:hypothetical protein